jgi:hypothetical protein
MYELLWADAVNRVIPEHPMLILFIGILLFGDGFGSELVLTQNHF